MPWSLDDIADIVSRIGAAYPNSNTANIVTVAFATGMTEQQIEGQLCSREKLNAALKEWETIEPRRAKEIAQNEMSVSDWRFRGSNELRMLVLKKLDVEKAKFLASKGVEQ